MGGGRENPWGRGKGAYMTQISAGGRQEKKKHVERTGSQWEEGTVTLPYRLARETTRSKIHKGGNLWPGAPRDMLFLTYMYNSRGQIYMYF